MRRAVTLSTLILLIVGTLQAAGPAPKPQWAMNATIIEACSCPMFCQCYFNAEPAAHGGHGAGEHFCKFNNAFKVNKGHYGNVKLDGLKFWVAGDLGGDFSKGQMDWAVLTFDKTMTKEQRAGVAAIVGHIYPVKWNSLTTAEGTIDKWTYDKDSAYATLDGGKSAEVKLKRHPGNTNEPVVIKNLKYWGVPRNDGFVLMPNEVEAYRVGEKAFEFKGTNGFMITFDINSNDVGVTQASMAH
ncbi:MAG TPA: DUF1326 domain-containing protein [Candidatus Polarisedimenticolia bacterium]|jgi:hypothetical protein|nr:DUF1326 domain-containing protein [Candidatus Polarisedimenticolia bacterium]